MSQAFYSAMTGLNAGQTKINVVADNIANMNTVGFKQSRVDFADIYYNTLSSGSAPGNTIGGINPRQIGTGVRVSSITRDFTGGSAVTTGISTHMSIKGNGFFTVLSPSEETLLTRAGNFSIDADGYLVLPNGYKAIGTDSQLGTTTSKTPVKIPTLIQPTTTPSPNAGTLPLSQLNGNVNVTPGTFTVSVDGAETEITITDASTLNSIAADIDAVNGVGASVVDGKLVITQDDPAAAVALNNGTSNFVTDMKLTENQTTHEFTSKVAHYHQEVNLGTDMTIAQKATNVDIYEDGTLEVTYANGDKLSVMQNPNDPTQMVFKYTTGNPAVTITGPDLVVPEGVAVPANFQIQMASVVNPEGLIAVGSNAYREGANSGMTMFGAISSGAFGVVNTGEYEGSNVDLAEQFADMVVSQRMIEANSRVFDAASQVMQTLTYLGRS